MNNTLWLILRAVRGPLLLIGLGVLFLIDQVGGLGFHRTWPILLVLYGVLKLAERLVAPPPIPPAPPVWNQPPAYGYGTAAGWTQPPQPPQAPPPPPPPFNPAFTKEDNPETGGRP